MPADHGVYEEPVTAHTQRKKHVQPNGAFPRAKVFPEEAAHGLAPHKAPVSPICNAATQSAMG